MAQTWKPFDPSQSPTWYSGLAGVLDDTVIPTLVVPAAESVAAYTCVYLGGLDLILSAQLRVGILCSTTT
eukprot:CAMPEP_0181057838 /NCGR_PEP_ID=MMETSP1070-20121207/20472_1 /TAXON_ID=265543 /ORGANISM="Minutocellus polymorphus, Strain NH13" /LENGTH=69 /DNA_ID=CAMNT_0023137295 /DNA_START=479 /DNA_END=689 /DNA_ORIENTATION=+